MHYWYSLVVVRFIIDYTYCVPPCKYDWTILWFFLVDRLWFVVRPNALLIFACRCICVLWWLFFDWLLIIAFDYCCSMNASWTVYLRSIRFAYCWTLLMLFVLLWWLLLLLINKSKKNIHSTWKDTVPSVSTGSSQSHPHIYEKMHYQRNSFSSIYTGKTRSMRASDPGKIEDRNCPIGTQRSRRSLIGWERSAPIGQFRSSIFPGSDSNT